MAVTKTDPEGPGSRDLEKPVADAAVAPVKPVTPPASTCGFLNEARCGTRAAIRALRIKERDIHIHFYPPLRKCFTSLSISTVYRQLSAGVQKVSSPPTPNSCGVECVFRAVNWFRRLELLLITITKRDEKSFRPAARSDNNSLPFSTSGFSYIKSLVCHFGTSSRDLNLF